MAKKSQLKEISQIHRIAGQIAGIEKMLKNKGKTESILQQIEAVKGNLKSLEKRILKDALKKIDSNNLEEVLSYLIKLS